eukprot:3473810-Rhodomonas_salina.1
MSVPPYAYVSTAIRYVSTAICYVSTDRRTPRTWAAIAIRYASTQCQYGTPHSAQRSSIGYASTGHRIARA